MLESFNVDIFRMLYAFLFRRFKLFKPFKPSLEVYQSFPCLERVLECGGMVQDGTFLIYTEVGECPVFLNGDRSEKCRCRRGRAVNTYLFLHSAHKEQKPVPVRAVLFLQRPVMEVLFTPERLATVDHDLRLSGKRKKIYRRGKDDPVGVPDRRVYLLHPVINNTDPRLAASAAILTGPDIHVIQSEDIDPVLSPVDPLQCR